MDALNHLQAETAAELDALDPAILAKVFRGELIPQDPNGEPAEKLLRRIETSKETKR